MTATFSVEVDQNHDRIWVCNVPFDPDQLITKAMQGLPYSNPCIANIPQEMWRGNENERAGLVGGRKDIPIYFPRRKFSTFEARTTMLANNFGCGFPCFLAPLKDERIRMALVAKGINWVVALGQNDDELWQFEGCSHAVYLNCAGLPGFYHRSFDVDVGYYPSSTENAWGINVAVVGYPNIPR